MIKVLLILILVFNLNANEDREDISIALKWFYQFQFAGIIMAQEKGFFDEAGLHVKIIERDPSKNTVQEVVNGNATYGVSDSSILTYRAKGYPVRIVASIFQHNAMVLISKKDSNILSPFDLKNKKISYQEGIDDAVFSSMFNYAGLDNNDIIKMPMDFSYQNFINDEADVIAAYITDQPYWISKKGHELNIINPLSYGIDLYGDTIFTTDDEVKNHPQRVKKLKDSIIKGWKYALEHSDETIDIILKKYNTQNLSRDALEYEAITTKRLIASDIIELGSTSKDRYKIIAAIYKHESLTRKDLENAVNSIIYDPDKKDNILNRYVKEIMLALSLFTILIVFVIYHNYKLKNMVRSRTQELEIALEAKSQFLANMSHEIRTPLNAILGYVDILSKREENEKRVKQFNIIKQSGRNLINIINDILDLSKIEAGKLDIENSNTDIEKMRDDIFSMFTKLADDKNINFTLDIEDGVHTCMYLDEVRVKQVIINLLSNAIKFTKDGGKVEANISYKKDRFIFSVTDSGIGIEKESLHKIFNSFEQEDGSTTRKFGGTGLGLSICSNLVHLMHGDIKVKSEKGVGSTFSFYVETKKC
jgi:signal transduction histidine kinase